MKNILIIMNGSVSRRSDRSGGGSITFRSEGKPRHCTRVWLLQYCALLFWIFHERAFVEAEAFADRSVAPYERYFIEALRDLRPRRAVWATRRLSTLFMVQLLWSGNGLVFSLPLENVWKSISKENFLFIFMCKSYARLIHWSLQFEWKLGDFEDS